MYLCTLTGRGLPEARAAVAVATVAMAAGAAVAKTAVTRLDRRTRTRHQCTSRLGTQFHIPTNWNGYSSCRNSQLGK